MTSTLPRLRGWTASSVPTRRVAAAGEPHDAGARPRGRHGAGRTAGPPGRTASARALAAAGPGRVGPPPSRPSTRSSPPTPPRAPIPSSDLGDLIVLMANSPNPVIENACLHTLEAGTPARLFPPPPKARGTTRASRPGHEPADRVGLATELAQAGDDVEVGGGAHDRARRAVPSAPGRDTRPGSRADLVAIEGTDLTSALSMASEDRIVVHRGRIVARTTVRRRLVG